MNDEWKSTLNECHQKQLIKYLNEQLSYAVLMQ